MSPVSGGGAGTRKQSNQIVLGLGLQQKRFCSLQERLSSGMMGYTHLPGSYRLQSPKQLSLKFHKSQFLIQGISGIVAQNI